MGGSEFSAEITLSVCVEHVFAFSLQLRPVSFDILSRLFVLRLQAIELLFLLKSNKSCCFFDFKLFA